jgi:O-acetylhomoserine/O-acetylserine sulfhydrylase-like pyridoxal-dependent enzyme
LLHRISNPTNHVFEERVTVLEGGFSATAVSSGKNNDNKKKVYIILKIIKYN